MPIQSPMTLGVNSPSPVLSERVHTFGQFLLRRDTGIEFHFSVTPSAFVARRRTLHPDWTISADARDFLLLGLHQEDADTLFFNRRLTLEGDTELGLFVKNTLDALEIPVLDIFRNGAKKVLI